MKRKRPVGFDFKSFVVRDGDGRTIMELRKAQALFSQGEPADSVFYILKGRVKPTVVSSQGKEAVIAVFGRRGGRAAGTVSERGPLSTITR